MSRLQPIAIPARKRRKVSARAEDQSEFIGDDPYVAMEGNTQDADRAEYEAPQASMGKNPVPRRSE